MKCPSCHSDNRDGAKFCNECGTSLDARRASDDATACESSTQNNSNSADDLDAAGKTRVVRPDTSGVDECLIDSTYVPRSPNWRAGDTMEIPRIRGAEDQQPSAKAYRAPDARPKKSVGRRVGIALLCVAVIGALAAAGAYHLELWGGKAVPNVTGKTQTDAEYMLGAKGFAVRVLQVPSDDTEGIVLLTDPGAGSRLEEGAEVIIHVSVMHRLPSVVGMSVDKAQSALAAEGFEAVTVLSEPSTEAEGTVLQMSPEADSRARTSDEVVLTVAGPYMVPSVEGLSRDEAVSALEAAGYVSVVALVADNSVEDGTVLGTDPAADSKLDPGSAVTIRVSQSRGAELEEVALSLLNDLAQSGVPLEVGNTNYAISSVNFVEYTAEETTAFSIEATPSVVTADGKVLTGELGTVLGAMTWTPDNHIETITAQAS